MNHQTDFNENNGMGPDFTGHASPGPTAEDTGIASKSVQNADYEFHAVTFRDARQSAGAKLSIRKLLSLDFLSAARQFPGADDDFPIFFYLSYGENVCAYLRAIPDLLTIDGRNRRWAWTGDNYTDPQFRRQGLSTRLQQAATRHLHYMGIGRGSVYSTEVTQRIFEKLGFTHVGYAKRFLLLRSLTPILEANISRRLLRRMTAGVLNPMVRFSAVCARGRNKMTLTRTVCRRMTDFSDLQFGQLLENIASRRSLHFGIQPDLLRQKFEIAKKSGTMSAWLILEKKTGESLAYMILRERFQDKPMAEKYRGFQLMSLADYALVNDDAGTVSALAGHCLEVFFQSGCDVLEIVSNKKCVHNAAVRRGLLPVGKGMSFNYSVPENWQWGAEQAQLEKWPLTGFCGDGFTF